MGSVTGADVLTASLEDQGIDTVFNIPGFGILPFVKSICQSESVDYICGMNETVVGFLAEGYSRATRMPSFVNVYQSTGTGFVMPPLMVAWGERTPLILSTTTNSRQLKGRDQYAAVPKDITEVTDQYTKWGFEVPSADRIPEAIDRAVSIATTPPMGPVHLAFPMDVYEESINLDNVDSRRGRTKIYDESRPDPEGIKRAAKALIRSERSAILAGGGVGKHYADAELKELAEITNSGIIFEGKTTYLPLSTDHPLYVGRSTGGNYGGVSSTIEGVDTLLLIGFELTETLPNQYKLRNTEKTIIQAESSSVDIGKQVTPDIALIGNPKSVLCDLTAAYKNTDGQKDEKDAQEFIKQQNTAYKNQLERDRNELARRMDRERPTPLEALLSEIDNAVGEDLTIVHDAGDEIPFIDSLEYHTPDDQYGISMKASVQGWAIPAGIGVQLGAPEREVVIIEGDGGFMFTGPNALYTAALYDIPITVILINNLGWRAGGYNDKIGAEWDDEMFLGRFDNPPIDFSALVNALGIESYTVDNPDRVRAVVEKIGAGNRPCLIEVKAGHRP
ncbi:thiamine pyrophosphate-binding protein [Natrialbaceae archaeon A-CW1-1]